jgi:hypothetical protein
MLANRYLPPPVSRLVPLPVATFYNIPRRYNRLSMSATTSITTMEDVHSTRTLRKGSRMTNSQPTSPVEAKEQSLPLPVPVSPRAAPKRDSSFDVEVNGEELARKSSVDAKDLPSASSTGSGELPSHVCLCQPEPKVPRPRNGKSESIIFFVIPDSYMRERVDGGEGQRERLFVCGRRFFSR